MRFPCFPNECFAILGCDIGAAGLESNELYEISYSLNDC
jgi:hypothetical protein